MRRVEGDEYELVHPPCVEEMWLDYQEGLDAWRAGEPEAARDALRFALQGCGDHLWIHVALGQIALRESNDPALARGHFGYAFELVRRALARDFLGRLPRERRANQPLYEAIEGLIACYAALGRPADAGELKRLMTVWSGSVLPTSLDERA